MTSQPSSPPAAGCPSESSGCPSATSCAAARACLAEPASQDRVTAVLRTLQRMREYPGQRHSLAGLAQTALLSQFHFHRIFRQVTATTPFRFLTALRMAEAKRLLVDTSLNVTEICVEVGYASLGTFTTQFTRQVGISPSRYRNAVLALGNQSLGNVLDRFQPDIGPHNAYPVRGLITSGPNRPALAAVGLFGSGIPQGQPAVSSVVPVPGVVEFAGQPDGDYHALAMCLDEHISVDRCLRDTSGPTGYVGAGRDLILVRGGESRAPFEIELRRPRAVDPPIVFAAPLLLAITAFGDEMG